SVGAGSAAATRPRGVGAGESGVTTVSIVFMGVTLWSVVSARSPSRHERSARSVADRRLPEGGYCAGETRTAKRDIAAWRACRQAGPVELLRELLRESIDEQFDGRRVTRGAASALRVDLRERRAERCMRGVDAGGDPRAPRPDGPQQPP